MTHVRKRDLYTEQRNHVGTKCLRTVHEWGVEKAVEIFKGNLAAIVMALISLIGQHETKKFINQVLGEIPPPRTKPSLIWNRDSAA